jgi:hypothetical protein
MAAARAVATVQELAAFQQQQQKQACLQVIASATVVAQGLRTIDSVVWVHWVRRTSLAYVLGA